MNLMTFLQKSKIRLDEIGFLSIVTDGLSKDAQILSVVFHNLTWSTPYTVHVSGGQPQLVSHITGLTPEHHAEHARGPHPSFAAIEELVKPYRYMLSYSVPTFTYPRLLRTWPAIMTIPQLRDLDDIVDHIRMRQAEPADKADVYGSDTVETMRQKLVVAAKKMPKPGSLDAVHDLTGLSLPPGPSYLQKVCQLRNIFSWLLSVAG